jgi:hypothetical protein
METTLKNRLSLLAGNYIGERSAVLVTADANVFYIENLNKCRNYCSTRNLEFIEITKADVDKAKGLEEKPKATEPTTEAQPKRTRRKRNDNKKLDDGTT